MRKQPRLAATGEFIEVSFARRKPAMSTASIPDRRRLVRGPPGSRASIHGALATTPGLGKEDFG